ncbi:MAG TPA: decarboxylating 6-phosphogluconate dehydrogenase [Gemmatimonadaceae bacterium]|nr:decarboxylating 6-phosphogluconate dehydrogenase [Gemmatimonadaceae bacterium]
MQLAMIGVGRMGGNMVRRLLRDGHDLVVYDTNPRAMADLVRLGAVGAADLPALCARLASPKVIWVMVPAGAPVDGTIAGLAPHLDTGDIVIDGGNSRFHDTLRRAAELRERGIQLVDAGTSGGIWGLEGGYCLMVGGSAEAVAHCEPAFTSLAPPDGYAHVGPTGAGHYVKMVHNGIEYGMLQAYAEGYEILHQSKHFDLDLRQIAAVWNHGSVIRSWLNELAERAFAGEADLASIRGYVEDSGEGRWTVQEAMELNLPAPIITLSLLARFRSRQDESFSAKVIAALRREFGGHSVKST